MKRFGIGRPEGEVESELGTSGRTDGFTMKRFGIGRPEGEGALGGVSLLGMDPTMYVFSHYAFSST